MKRIRTKRLVLESRRLYDYSIGKQAKFPENYSQENFTKDIEELENLSKDLDAIEAEYIAKKSIFRKKSMDLQIKKKYLINSFRFQFRNEEETQLALDTYKENHHRKKEDVEP